MLTVGQGFIIFVFVGSLPFAIGYFMQKYFKHLHDKYKFNYWLNFDEYDQKFKTYGYTKCDSNSKQDSWINNNHFVISFTFKTGKWKISEYIRTTPQWDWVECPFYKGRNYNKLLKVLEQQDKLYKQHIIKQKLQQINEDFT